MELETDENDALYVTAAVILGISILGFLCHVPRCVRGIWKRLSLVKWNCFCPSVRDECLSEQICQQKTALSQKFSWYARLWSTCWTAWIVVNYWTKRNQLLMNASGHWFVVIFLALMLLPTHFPRILRRFHFSLDVNYITCQLFVAMILSPWTFQPGAIEELVVAGTAFVMCSLPSAAFALNSVVVVTCQTFIWLLVACRAWTEEAMQYPILLTLFGFWHIPIALLVFQLTDTLMLQEAESKIRERDSRIQMNAADALLQLTCDAVLELDTELRLVEDNPNLTTMLLGRPGASLKGRKFSDFISSRDQRRATELLQQDARAIAFHTRLVDSYSSKFRTEVFQVKYTKMNGQKCHLLGLRDFTDVKPLAGDTATDAIRDSVAQAPVQPPLPAPLPGPAPPAQSALALAALPGLRRGWSHSSDASNNSYDMIPISEHSADSWAPEDSQRTLNSGIVENRVKLSHKEAFLEINLDKEVISAASAPFAALSGQSLTAVFATDFSCHLFHRMCSDARTALERADKGERGERGDSRHMGLARFANLPDQVVAFHKMPLFVSGTLVEASGIMKACATFEGHLRVQMCFVADSSKWRGDVCKACKCSSQWSL
ncbi:unnamed protein product [Cladocopium goreaui]|uniref:Nudix hydrolase 8 n=1 Tax=Cladocopium goreaui TaxID=2562237 RepID=A0A9P1CE20_9DINO|nr:unnamed protein product [Cladocopium goreaui]